ncbi:MAG TPA: PDZ domain-containing protein [Actinomycetes bacterium]|nr:PDZ domain-containing protein [Actinomycetes bacterium]
MTRRARSITLALGGALLAILLVVAFLLPVPYVRLRPGPVFNALGEVGGQPVITIDGARTYETSGSLDVTTVYEEGGPGNNLTLIQAFRGWTDPAMAVVPREMLYPPELYNQKDAAEQVKQEGVVQMQSSEETAVVAALRYVGEPVHVQVVVDSTMPDAPADGKLQAGDVLVAVDGQRVHKATDVRDIVSSVDVGDSVEIVIERDGQRQTVRLTTAESPDEKGRPIIGVLPTVSYQSPVTVDIKLADVGGPSAGLMFALSVVDKLTPEQLAGGLNIAGTGTMDPAGKVGPIGGIAQKMAGARDDGAEVFLAPASNCSDVAGHIPDGLRVVKVETLDDAIHSVEQLDDPTASLPTCNA